MKSYKELVLLALGNQTMFDPQFVSDAMKWVESLDNPHQAIADRSDWFYPTGKITPKPCPFCQKTRIRPYRAIVATDQGQLLFQILYHVPNHCE